MDNEIQQFCDDLLESVCQMNANERASETIIEAQKVSATVEFERDIFDKFYATGADWQHQINYALKQWLQEHPLVHSA